MRKTLLQAYFFQNLFKLRFLFSMKNEKPPHLNNSTLFFGPLKLLNRIGRFAKFFCQIRAYVPHDVIGYMIEPFSNNTI